MKCSVGLLSFLSLFSAGALGCSIVGYIGDKPCKNIILEQLSQLEYRGYDSAGFACLHPQSNRLVCIKRTGRLQNLVNALNRDPIEAHIAIGHTRWATHGPATEDNAHPHCDTPHSLALVHNGIIENHFTLRDELLKKNCKFVSATDTEVIAHQLHIILREKNDLKDAVLGLVKKLKGAYGIVGVVEKFSDTLVAIRKGSPLCLGVGQGEMFVASDVLAFNRFADKVIYLPNKSFALVKKDGVKIYDFNGEEIEVQALPIEVKNTVSHKNGQDHFMLKEIYEQPQAIEATVNFYRSIKKNFNKYINVTDSFIKNFKSIEIVACGTSWHAGRIGQFFFELLGKIPTGVHLASEFRYSPFVSRSDALYILISQSGETADTLAVLRRLNKNKLQTLTITNVASSTMARESCGVLQTLAGPEVAVASTKAFTTQLTALYWLAHYFAYKKDILSEYDLKQAEKDLIETGVVLQKTIDLNKEQIINSIAKKYSAFQRFFFLGRHVGYPFAMEAALKLKEISYIFAMGYPAGELKHGSIALIDEQTPTVVFSSVDPVIYQKIVSNVQEVKARNGNVIVFAFEGQDELVKLADQAFIVPRVKLLLEPLAMSGTMQFFAYQIAKELGRDIDKPRNLAKSVTVE